MLIRMCLSSISNKPFFILRVNCMVNQHASGFVLPISPLQSLRPKWILAALFAKARDAIYVNILAGLKFWAAVWSILRFSKTVELIAKLIQDLLLALASSALPWVYIKLRICAFSSKTICVFYSNSKQLFNKLFGFSVFFIESFRYIIVEARADARSSKEWLTSTKCSTVSNLGVRGL